MRFVETAPNRCLAPRKSVHAPHHRLSAVARSRLHLRAQAKPIRAARDRGATPATSSTRIHGFSERGRCDVGVGIGIRGRRRTGGACSVSRAHDHQVAARHGRMLGHTLQALRRDAGSDLHSGTSLFQPVPSRDGPGAGPLDLREALQDQRGLRQGRLLERTV